MSTLFIRHICILHINYFCTLYLKNVLVTPKMIKNFIFIRKLTRENKCSIEFVEFGFSVKDFMTKQLLLRCDNSGDLYSFTKSNLQAFVSINSSLWHQRLGHPSQPVFKHLISINSISCNKKSLLYFAMLVNLENMLVYLFPCLKLMSCFAFKLYFPMGGYLLYKVRVVLNIVRFFLINLCTLFGCILLEINLMCSQNFITFTPLLNTSFKPTFNISNAIMERNMTTLIFANFVTLMVFTCVCRVLIPPKKW